MTHLGPCVKGRDESNKKGNSKGGPLISTQKVLL